MTRVLRPPYRVTFLLISAPENSEAYGSLMFSLTMLAMGMQVLTQFASIFDALLDKIDSLTERFEFVRDVFNEYVWPFLEPAIVPLLIAVGWRSSTSRHDKEDEIRRLQLNALTRWKEFAASRAPEREGAALSIQKLWKSHKDRRRERAEAASEPGYNFGVATDSSDSSDLEDEHREKRFMGDFGGGGGWDAFFGGVQAELEASRRPASRAGSADGVDGDLGDGTSLGASVFGLPPRADGGKREKELDDDEDEPAENDSSIWCGADSFPFWSQS